MQSLLALISCKPMAVAVVRGVLPWLLVFLLCCGSARGLSPDAAIRDLKRTAWDSADGVPDAIRTLAQTSDGYLWLGNATGLFRFDGLRFERHALPRGGGLASTQVSKLFAPASGGLWIGFTMGGIAFLDHGALTLYGEPDGFPRGSVKAIALDHDGTLWAGTSSALARQVGSRWQQVLPGQGYPGLTKDLLVDSAGTLWSVSTNAVLFLPRGQTYFQSSGPQPDFNTFEGIAESPAGEVWLCTQDRLQLLRKNGKPARFASAPGLNISFDRDGSLWCKARDGPLQRIGRPQGLQDTTWAQVVQTGRSYSSDSRTPGYLDAGILEDREGNIWFASSTGLVRYSERKVTPALQTTQSAFNADVAALAAADGGGVWVAERMARLIHFQDGITTRHDQMVGHSCAYRDDDGAVWFARYFALRKHTANGFERVALPAGTANEVQAITRTGDDLWVSIVRQGVYRLAGGVWTVKGGIDDLPELAAITLTTDAAGRIWFGYADGRIAVLDGGSLDTFSGQRLPSIGNVTALYGKRARIWAGGEFGLAVLDGATFRAVTADTGPAINSVTGIVETAAGELWVNSSAGIVHFSAEQTRRIAGDPHYRPEGEIFNALDGVEGTSARLRPLPTAVEGTDGTLWFLTSAGLYSIDPTRIQRNPVLPTVQIESIQSGDTAYPPDTRVTLPPGSTSLRIGYAGLSLTVAERVRYRYRLSGVDADWQDAGTRREVFYTDLGPGNYPFQVIAANNDGVWNRTGETLQIVIPPTFMQTGWFIALCMVGAGLLIWMLVWLRVRQVGARMRVRYEERMAERERIARELHDTLLQSTQGLILCFHAATDQMAANDPTRIALGAELDRAEAVLAEGRDRVLDLRVSAQPLDDLPAAYAATARELGQGRKVQFRVDVEGTPRELQPVVQDEAYRIGREALLNACRHARAARIEIQIVYAADQLRVCIRDDGIGMDTRSLDTAARPDHWGLRGMHERAQRIGAELAVSSRPGTGTEIELRISAARAYQAAPRRRWFAGRG